MFTLIFAIIFGLGLAFFALQNTNSSTVTLAGIPFENIPVWLIVVLSLLLGLILASYFNVINILTSALKMHDKDKTIKDGSKIIADLKSEIHNLKAENANLKAQKNNS